MFRQAVPRIGLSMERGTEAVPEDGQYHVLLDGHRMFTSPSEKDALVEYRRLKDLLLGADPPKGGGRADIREALMREMAERQATAFLAESARQKRVKALRKGGPGGSGGVSS